MNTIKVILEVGKDGYGVSFPEIKNIFGFGETLDAAKEDAQKVLDFYIECLTKDKKSLPTILQGEYSLAFELETPPLSNL